MLVRRGVLLVVGSWWRLVWLLVRWRAAGGTVLWVRRVPSVPTWGDRLEVADRLERLAVSVPDAVAAVDLLVAAGWLREWRHPGGYGSTGRLL